MRTSGIGDGVVPGAEVRLTGVTVGTIASVDSPQRGQQLVTLSLRPSKLHGLTDSFDIDYAPSNLFGISSIVLKRRSGGNLLHDSAIVDLTATGRVTDVTMGNLLRGLSATATDILTPRLTELLTKAGADLAAFTPIIQALISVSRAVADSQRFPSSFLIEQYGAFFDGVAKFSDGTIKLIYEVYGIDVLRTDRAHFDVGVGLVTDQLFPYVANLGWTAQKYLSGYTDTFGTLLNQLALMVPAPGRSATNLTELLDRWNRTFTDTPTGPELNLAITLRGVPGLAVPLLGGRPLPTGGR
ncbi:Mce family protein [Nocardia uniformis]|uniref:Mce family protein n=1 Tax=Nocardia uniformis TaxID=53432 RepID=A0A849C910_9NOCA|nr:Mce family protein [Nocardia uniformis]